MGDGDGDGECKLNWEFLITLANFLGSVVSEWSKGSAGFRIFIEHAVADWIIYGYAVTGYLWEWETRWSGQDADRHHAYIDAAL